MHAAPTTDVLIAGETLIDIVRRLDGTQAESPGGSPANVGITLGRLGRAAALVTHVGDDERGAAIRSWLDASAVTLVSAPTGRTSTAQATLDSEGAATYEFDLSLDLEASGAPDAAVVHTGSIASVLEPSADRLRELVETRRPSALITYDPNIRPSLIDDAARVRQAALDCIARAHVVKASDEDVAFLLPGVASVDAAREWVAAGPGLVVVTMGGDGAVAVRDGSVLEIETPRVQVADTVGAGDTFMGALIDGLLTAGIAGPGAEERLREVSEEVLQQLLDRAARAASITVSRPGANPPTSAELDA